MTVSCEYGNEVSVFMQSGEFVDQLRNCYFLQICPAPWAVFQKSTRIPQKSGTNHLLYVSSFIYLTLVFHWMGLDKDYL
jgi:hypothetical protein